MESLFGYDADMRKRWHDDEGLRCPTCGAAMPRVVETRTHKGFVFRLRVCGANRLHRATTVEIFAGGGSLSPAAKRYVVKSG